MLKKTLLTLLVLGWSVIITADEVVPNAVEKFRLGMQLAREKSGAIGSPEEAFRLLKDSANMHYPPAIYAVIWAYYSRIGVDKNLPLAIANCRQAANSGDAEGQFMMAVLYGAREGVAKDSRRPLHWFKLAAENSHKEAKSWWAG